MPLQPDVPTTPSRCWDRPRVCVEVTQVSNGNLVRVRDTKQRTMRNQPALLYTADEWVAFIEDVKAGEFDFNFALLAQAGGH
jgi:flagellar biosynthesis regulator FlaF